MLGLVTRDLERLLDTLPPRPRVVVSGNAATPWTLLRLFDAAVESYVLHQLNPQPGVPDRPGVRLETPFVGPGARRSPRLSYLPVRLSLVPLLYADRLRPDVVLLHTSLPHDGTVSLGTEVNVLPAAVEAVRRRGGLVVAQLDPAMPYVYGDGVLPLSWLDATIEACDPPGSPLPSLSDDASQGVAANVARRIRDGATIQTGIGSIPDAVLSALHDRRGLRFWSEMISDGVLDLEKAGALDPETVITCSFLFGSPELYAWADHNPRLRLRRTEVTNDPSLISGNEAMISLNTALQVDLYAQVNASRMHGRPHSGFGGQTDFIVGALHAPRGQAVIALRSWHPRADVSTVVPMVDEPVTSFQPSAVVTEQGTAELWGRSEREQAALLVSQAAHPRARDELREEGRSLGLLD